MLKQTTFLASTVALLFSAACTTSPQTDDSSLTQCDHGCGGHDDNGDGDGSGGGGGGGSGGGSGDVGGTVDVDAAADVDIDVVGTGLYVGLNPLCSLDVSGDFHATAHANATINGDTLVVTDIDAMATIETGNGCSCNGLNLDASASVSLSASVTANTASCGLFCDAHASLAAAAQCGNDAGCKATVAAGVRASCMTSCDCAGNVILADASADLSANASLSIGSNTQLDALIGASLAVHLRAVVNAAGSVVINL